MNTIFGKGKLNKEVQFHAKSLVFTFISQYREQMTLEQLRKSVHIICKNLLDPAVTLNMKNSLIFIIYRKHEELMLRTKQENQDLLLEILESLVRFLKDLEYQMRITVQEFSIFKQEVASSRSTHTKWMNDYEQKNANYRDLFISDDYTFAESQPEFDMKKVEEQYYFYN